MFRREISNNRNPNISSKQENVSFLNWGINQPNGKSWQQCIAASFDGKELVLCYDITIFRGKGSRDVNVKLLLSCNVCFKMN